MPPGLSWLYSSSFHTAHSLPVIPQILEKKFSPYIQADIFIAIVHPFGFDNNAKKYVMVMAVYR